MARRNRFDNLFNPFCDPPRYLRPGELGEMPYLDIQYLWCTQWKAEQGAAVEYAPGAPRSPREEALRRAGRLPPGVKAVRLEVRLSSDDRARLEGFAVAEGLSLNRYLAYVADCLAWRLEEAEGYFSSEVPGETPRATPVEGESVRVEIQIAPSTLVALRKLGNARGVTPSGLLAGFRR